MSKNLKKMGIIGALLLIWGIRCSNNPLHPNTCLPLPPTGLSCQLNSLADVLLAWRDNASNEIGFLVERSVGDSRHFAFVDTLVANAEQYLDANLAPGFYCYRIKAFNTTGISLPSNVAEIVISELVPSAPASFRITRRGFFSIALAWEDPSTNENGYVLERSRDDSLHFTQILNLAPNTTSFEDTLLDPGVLYSYRIRGFNAYGWSNYSETISAFTRIPSLSVTPASVTISSRDRITLTLNLTDPMDALFGISMRVVFDQNILEFITSSAGAFFGPDVITFSEHRDNTVYVTLTLRQGMTPVRTSGELGSITFKAIGLGNANVTVLEENLHFYDDAGNIYNMPSLQIQNAQITVR